MVLSNDLNFILIFFPGFLFTLVSIFSWLLISNYIFQKIDHKSNVHILQIVYNVFNDLKSNSINKKFSNGLIFLMLRLMTIFIFHILILTVYFSSKEYNAYFLLFIWLIAIIFDFFYQFDQTNASILIFIGKIFSEIIIIISMALFLYINNDSTFNGLSTSLANQISLIEMLLVMTIIYSISKISTYVDYKKVQTFSISPNDLTLYNHNIENGNILEKILRWINESYSQIIFAQLLTLLFFQSILQALNIDAPLWVDFLLFILIQAFLLILSLYLNLLNPELEFKLLNQKSRVLIVIIFLFFILNLN